MSPPSRSRRSITAAEHAVRVRFGGTSTDGFLRTSFRLQVALVALTVALTVLVGALLRGASSSWSFGRFAGYAWRGRVASVQASWTVPRIRRVSPPGHAGTWIGAQAPGALGPFVQIGT